MGAELTGYAAGAAVVGAHHPQPESGSRSTDTASFNSKVATWDDLPAESRRIDSGRAEPIAEGFETPKSVAHRVNGTLYKVRVAWRAYVDRVVVIRVGQPLGERPDGKLFPVGDWTHLNSDVYMVGDTPKRTVGVVPTGTLNASDTESESAGAGVPREHRFAADQFLYLPAQVRATVLRAVPQATVWTAQFTQYSSTTGVPRRHVLSMLRLSDAGAVVIRAERELTRQGLNTDQAARALASTPWSVTQVVYNFSNGTASPTRIGNTAKRFQIGRR